MKNTTKHVGVVAAVLTAAGITGACPGTAFADSTAGQAPANGSTLGASTQHLGSDRHGDDNLPIVVHGPGLNRAPILDGGPILDRGPGRHFDNDGWDRFDNDGRGRYDNDGRGRYDNDGRDRYDNDGRGRYDNDRRDRRFDNDDWDRRFDNDRPIVIHERVRRVDEVRTWVSQSQAGTVCSVTGGNIVVNGADGTTWTWTTDPATKVRIVGVWGTLADLRAGDRIQVTGLLNGTDRLAESVVAVDRAETFVTVARTETFMAPRHAETFMDLSRREMFVTGRHGQFHRQDERGDRCEHSSGWHERGEHCEHHAKRGWDRGGRHRR
jgi:hypothetical protein